MRIGIIGAGDMGKLYARRFAKAGYDVCACDLPEKKAQVEKELEGTGIEILDGTTVSKTSDYIIYSVEAENVGKVVAEYGPHTKKHAIVGGQTSVKTPEIEAFEKYLRPDVDIVTCHSLHGPKQDPRGQTLATIRHRSSDKAHETAMDVLRTLGSDIVELPDCMTHDRITADTQAVTHIGFESMGTAWKNAVIHPWRNPVYARGIDAVKALTTLRIYNYKSHILAGLAILNPFAGPQIKQYAESVSELFQMMKEGDEAAFRERIKIAAHNIFTRLNPERRIMLDDELMNEFALNVQGKVEPNSDLSLFSMVDAWYALGINPYDNLVCQTPPFKLRLGIVEYLFRNYELLEQSIHTALSGKETSGDREFREAALTWASIVERHDMAAYKALFEDTRAFFEDMIPAAVSKSNRLIDELSTRRK